MDVVDLAAVRKNLDLKSDLELIDILKKNKEDEWLDGVFEIIEEILVNRGLKPPERKLPVTKKNDKQDIPTVDKTNKYYGVKGWLLFFCSLQIFFKPALAIFLWISSSHLLESTFRYYPALKTISIFEIISGLFILIYGFDIGFVILTKKAYAVRSTRTFLVVNLITALVTGVFPFFVGLPSNIQKYFGSQFLRNSAGALIFFAIWYAYFVKSIRVKATFPFYNVQKNNNRT